MALNSPSFEHISNEFWLKLSKALCKLANIPVGGSLVIFMEDSRIPWIKKEEKISIFRSKVGIRVIPAVPVYFYSKIFRIFAGYQMKNQLNFQSEIPNIFQLKIQFTRENLLAF